MDDGLDFSRSQEEESRTARVIRKCSSLFTQFISLVVIKYLKKQFQPKSNFINIFVNKILCIYRGLENLQTNRRSSLFCSFVNLNEMVMCLEDLINYFAQPEEDMGKYNNYSLVIICINYSDIKCIRVIINILKSTKKNKIGLER